MSAVRKASSKAAAKKAYEDTDSDEDYLVNRSKGHDGARNAEYAADLQPIPEQDPSTPTKKPAVRRVLTTVIVFGADGNLARRKTFPALFNLMYKDLIAHDTVIVGYARASMDTDSFRSMVYKAIYKPTVPNQPRNEFLQQVTYGHGEFDDLARFEELRAEVEAREAEQLQSWRVRAHSSGSEVPTPQRVRLYYLAVPSFLYYNICRCLKVSGLAADEGVDRFVLEKPFGRDSATCDELLCQLGEVLTEKVTYRIDHYLGKELIMNLLVLRFANICFEAIWNRVHINSVQVIFKEKVGLDGRGGYFDQYGVIRDVMQNHLLQTLALVAMEQPLSLSAHHILQEKIKVLSSVRPLRRSDLNVGQYSGYLEEESITNKQSTTETFAVAVLHINNPRWAGVPFVLKAGKALNENRAEVRVRFNRVPGAMDELASSPENELIIRVQPNEGIYWKIQNKVPGLSFQVAPMRMDLTYQSKYSTEMPEAYERLILHALQGDKSNFVHETELRLSWQIFTPVLHELERSGERPQPYTMGSRGPASADELAARYGMRKFGSLRADPGYLEEQMPRRWGSKGDGAIANGRGNGEVPVAGAGASARGHVAHGAKERKHEWPGTSVTSPGRGGGAGGGDQGPPVPVRTSSENMPIVPLVQRSASVQSEDDGLPTPPRDSNPFGVYGGHAPSTGGQPRSVNFEPTETRR
mmetsp:Transcript_22151/g.69074  ORF Transcript_22151/g.69074 Transcript_22151/m.69074 type:complete len:696 (-) Transcript_22151:385-2472(-)